MSPRKVLVAHNAYQQLGGEDVVVQSEVALLRAHGHTVIEYLRNNDDIASMSKGAVAQQTLWSKRSQSEMYELLLHEQPDVLHVHNTFPLISPSIYGVAARLGTPVVQTLHNFRLLCPQAMFLREGKVCEDCLGKLPWRGAIRGCYRDSRLQSTVLAGMLVAHRALGTWQHGVTRYIALNAFCRNKFIAGGLPAQRIAIKPNFVDHNPSADLRHNACVFVGRLSPEKGLDTLLRAVDAMPDAPPSVRVVGTGPMEAHLRLQTNLRLLGKLRHDHVLSEMATARAVIVPSIWYETFGLVIIEAFACGTPVIASRIGALAELVQDGVTGLLFEPGNANDLAAKMRWAQQNPKAMETMGHNARKHYEAEFTGEQNYRQLMAIYLDAMDEVHSLNRAN